MDLFSCKDCPIRLHEEHAGSCSQHLCWHEFCCPTFLLERPQGSPLRIKALWAPHLGARHSSSYLSVPVLNKLGSVGPLLRKLRWTSHFHQVPAPIMPPWRAWSLADTFEQRFRNLLGSPLNYSSKCVDVTHLLRDRCKEEVNPGIFRSFYGLEEHCNSEFKHIEEARRDVKLLSIQQISCHEYNMLTCKWNDVLLILSQEWVLDSDWKPARDVPINWKEEGWIFEKLEPMAWEAVFPETSHEVPELRFGPPPGKY